MKLRTLAVFASLSIALPLLAQSSYQHPPKEILDVINAPALPFRRAPLRLLLLLLILCLQFFDLI